MRVRDDMIVTNHLDSPVQVVDVNSGVITQDIKYNVWGEIISDTNPGVQPFGFAGCLYDQDTKLCRFGARDYDSSIGRWLSKDPILFNGGDLKWNIVFYKDFFFKLCNLFVICSYAVPFR